MGGAGIAVADDSIAWQQNPAGLGALGIRCMPGKTWGGDALGAYGKEGDSHMWGLSASAWDPASRMGVGAGYVNNTGGSDYGIGFGLGLKDCPLSLGVNVIRDDPDFGDSTNTFNAGALYSFGRRGAAPIKLGLLVEDLSNESDFGPFFDLGVSSMVTSDLLVAVDCVDVTNKSDAGPYFDLGAEYALGTNKAWKVRAGLFDTGDGHDLTLGAGYAFANNWRLDAGWKNSDPNSVWSVGVSAGF
jgi:hypothetical protein